MLGPRLCLLQRCNALRIGIAASSRPPNRHRGIAQLPSCSAPTEKPIMPFDQACSEASFHRRLGNPAIEAIDSQCFSRFSRNSHASTPPKQADVSSSRLPHARPSAPPTARPPANLYCPFIGSSGAIMVSIGCLEISYRNFSKLPIKQLASFRSFMLIIKNI